MPLAGLVECVQDATGQAPRLAQLAGVAGLVALAFAARQALGVWLPDAGLPFLLFWPAIMLAAVLFSRGAGYLATGLALPAAAWFLPPTGSLAVSQAHHVLGLALFAAAGISTGCAVDSLRRALQRQRQAERRQAAQLAEFRHRSRNDLQNLCALLLLRARLGPPEARQALREAADHAFSLARVHTRIAAALAEDGASVDTAAFLGGLADDLAAGQAARPVAISTRAEAHPISTERAVQLGQVVTECIGNALRGAYPDGRTGTIRVWFAREWGDFALAIEDDGIGLPEAGAQAGLGLRLLRALGAQLRGTFTREARPAGGTICRLRFPVAEPGG